MVVRPATSKEGTEAMEGASAVVVHFAAEWAEPCAHMAAVLDDLAAEHEPALRFVHVDADACPELCESYNIETVPTFVFLHGARETERLAGADAAALTLKVRQNALTAKIHTDTPIVSAMAELPLKERLRKLTRASPVMLFMKGDRTTPRCGFSRKMVALLDAQKVKYTTFDILEDEEVRQGLKEFSKWPTYPQLYANGALLGGLDIVSELAKDGELADALHVQNSP